MAKDTREIHARYDKWRLYHRRHGDGSTHWYAFQPEHLDAPMFTEDGSPRYGRCIPSGSEALTHLQDALAKAAA